MAEHAAPHGTLVKGMGRILAFGFAAHFLVALVNVLATPLLLKLMGVEAYGLVAFFTTLQAWVLLFDFGVSPALARQLSRHRAGALAGEDAARMFAAAEIVFILAASGVHFIVARREPFFFGNYWDVLAGALVSMGHIALVLALASHLHGVRAGYRHAPPLFASLARWLTLESMIVIGLVLAGFGAAELAGVYVAWNSGVLTLSDSIFPVVLGTLLLSLGAQTILGGFLLAIIGGNESRFIPAGGDG